MIASITRLFNSLRHSRPTTWLLFAVSVCLLTGGLGALAMPARSTAPTVPEAQIISRSANSGEADKNEEPAVVAAQVTTEPVAPATPPVTTQSCALQTTPESILANITTLQPGYHQAEPAINYYKIYGNSPTEIYNQMIACGPLFPNGARYAAATAYNFNWIFDTQAGESSCSLTNIKVMVRSDILMPSWQKSGTASFQANSYWASSSRKLLMHELEHADIAEAAARGLYDQLISLPPADNCNAVRRQGHELGHRASVDVRQAQATYDSVTDHGRN